MTFLQYIRDALDPKKREAFDKKRASEQYKLVKKAEFFAAHPKSLEREAEKEKALETKRKTELRKKLQQTVKPLGIKLRFKKLN